MADVFDTGQIVAKPFSALSQKGVENRLERLNTETIVNPDDSTFRIVNTSGDISFVTLETVSQQVEFQFKVRLGDPDDGVAFIELNTEWLQNDTAEPMTIPAIYRNRPFTLIVSTRLQGANKKPPFVQQAVIPAWPESGATLTYNTCDND